MNSNTLLLLAIAALLTGGCSNSGRDPVPTEVSEREKNYQVRLAELAVRHNACDDWLESVPDRGFGMCFTVDLARALIRTNGQPVVMRAVLEDISEKDGAFTAHFIMRPIYKTVELDGGRHFRDLNLRLALRCSVGQAEQLMKTGRPQVRLWASRFALAAKVESVFRPALEVVMSESGDTGFIEFGATPDMFCANGTCIDLVELESPLKK